MASNLRLSNILNTQIDGGNTTRKCMFCGRPMLFDSFAPEYVCGICAIRYGVCGAICGVVAENLRGNPLSPLYNTV